MAFRHKEAEKQPDMALLELGSDFSEAHIIWNAEAKFILEQALEKRMEKRQQQGADYDFRMNDKMLQQTLEYAKKYSSNYNNKEAISVAKSLMTEHQGIDLHDIEKAQINNLYIDTPDEAFTLLPSLKPKFEDPAPLKQLLDDVRRLQSS